jgi:hypothetical protein
MSIKKQMTSKHIEQVITKYDLLFEQRLTRTETLCEKLEQDMTEIRVSYRWLIGIMIGGFSGMFGLMAHGFKWWS